MSDIIQLLPDHVANQIAAGEVVQRPASIVKELMENAIDAGASKVELIVRNAGKNLIQVVDNGVGMSDTDARLAFERHATSKIKSTEDIFKIATKGFRGEALASIAAVAQVELKTKKAEASVGTNIYIEGGELQFQEPVQTLEGSNFLIKNLFFNVPARRKFLKNDNIEFRHIIDEFQRVALAHENVEFEMFHNDEPIFRLRKGGQMQRIVEVFGRKIQPLLIPIKEDLGWVTLNGFVAKPEGAKKTRGEQFFFVNGRYFRSPYLSKAVQEAFEGLLQPGYIPSFFLYLELDPEKIDVNIHPQKTEVKFEDEVLIFALLRSTIKKALGIYNIAPSLDFDRDPAMDAFFQPQPSKANIEISSSGGSSFSKAVKVDRSFNPFTSEKTSAIESFNLSEMYNADVPTAEPSKINLFEDDDDLEEDLFRLPNGYWLFNKDGKTLMLDLGRIHRVILQSQQKEFKPNKNGQHLLFSIEYHLNEIEKNKYKSIKKYLPSLGFDMVIAHDNVLRINAVPEGLNESAVAGFLEKIFEILDYRTEDEFMSFYQDQWLKVHSKSKFDFIYKTEVEQLIKDFIDLGFPQYTAYGKKCFEEIPFDDFKNKF
ncbi:DNA mismatch repair endonuclease MutL [Soonwooa sp.]|uniref:DNA mismatch repair endonuclease MutL n=1 Tax=Soonwooa sp. TaxID=1938592 RepID=UPI0035B2DE0F